MHTSKKYTLLDGTIVFAEGPVTFPYKFNPRIDFMEATKMMLDGARVRRVGTRLDTKGENTQYGEIRSSRCEGATLPTRSEFWWDKLDGFLPYAVRDEDRLLKAWVVTYLPGLRPPMTWENFLTVEDAPSQPAHSPNTYKEKPTPF